MSSTTAPIDPELGTDHETDRIVRLRCAELRRAGYPLGAALILATSPDVELFAAIDLLSRGCPCPTALQILL